MLSTYLVKGNMYKNLMFYTNMQGGIDMYDNNYEEYIRSILGYPSRTSFNQNIMYSAGYPQPIQVNTRNDLEEFYPEIYKIIYPMIKKACNENMRANTRKEIEQMTDEIYSAIEDNNQINVNINLGNNISSTSKNTNQTENRNETKKEETNKKTAEKENNKNQDRRRPVNNNLRDLIKILLIRELLGIPNNNFPRPPHNKPPRPPHNSPRPPMRPPIMPRDYQQPLYDIYEY